MKTGRDRRYTAFLILALIFILVLLAYHRGHVQSPWNKVPYGAEEPFPGFPVDINSAGVESLRLLPGIGAKTAEAIIAERETEGSFAAIEDIRNVRGIGEQKFEALKGYIIVIKGGQKG